MAGHRQIPHGFGDEDTGQRPAVFLPPTRTVPDITDETLHLDEFENRHETLVCRKGRTDLLGQHGEKFPLKSVPGAR